MQLTKELEAAKARVEDEVIATVQIATKLEGRLRQAKQDADLAQQQAQQAQQRASQVLYCILVPSHPQAACCTIPAVERLCSVCCSVTPCSTCR